MVNVTFTLLCPLWTTTKDSVHILPIIGSLQDFPTIDGACGRRGLTYTGAVNLDIGKVDWSFG
jgi:hypothetical protein